MAIPLNSAADRRRPTLWDGVVAICILVAAGVILWLLPVGEQAGETAVVTVNGEERMQLSLTVPGDYPLEVPFPMTVTVEGGQVYVSETQCPGGDCQHTGPISRSGQTIVCLPNRVVISIRGGSTNSIDAVTG